MVVTAAGCALLVSACGSGSSKPSSSKPSSSKPSSSKPSSSKPSEASKSASQIVADAAAAVRTVHAYRAQGIMIEAGKAVSLSFTIASPMNFEVTFISGLNDIDVIEAAGTTYLRANAAYFASQNGPAQYANHWLKVPGSQATTLANLANILRPATIARCLGEDTSTLTVAGSASVDGQPAVIVKDAGGIPGSAPGELFVATSGTPYPLREVATGARKPGGKVDVCNDGKGDDGKGDITLSEFNTAPAIPAPAGAETIG